MFTPVSQPVRWQHLSNRNFDHPSQTIVYLVWMDKFLFTRGPFKIQIQIDIFYFVVRSKVLTYTAIFA